MEENWKTFYAAVILMPDRDQGHAATNLDTSLRWYSPRYVRPYPIVFVHERPFYIQIIMPSLCRVISHIYHDLNTLALLPCSNLSKMPPDRTHHILECCVPRPRTSALMLRDSGWGVSPSPCHEHGHPLFLDFFLFPVKLR